MQERTATSANRRLLSVDSARAIAVFAMFAAHIGPPAKPEGAGYLLVAFDGRAPAVFTLIAGLSLTLSRGGTQPRPPLTGTLRATLVRCAVLAVLGMALAELRSGIAVILTFFAVYFLTAEPLARLRTRALIAVAAISVVLGPVLSYSLGPYLGHRAAGRGGYPGFDAVTGWPGFIEALDTLLVSGAYPWLTYFPYVIVGMALGRVANLTRPGTARRLIGWGALAVLAGHGLSALALGPAGGRAALLDAIAHSHAFAMNFPDPVEAVLARQAGAIPSTSWAWLLVDDPYSQTPFETIANIGAGWLLIGLAVAACRHHVLELLLRPLAVVGTMGLSVYTLHVLARAELQPQHGWPTLGAFCGVSLVGCAIWAYAFRGTSLGRGPLEWALQTITPVRKAPTPESRTTQESLTLRG
ncbi:heparan-alpha-glucosaminide N-acetyltransferase domain-containing protein [Streptomyces sp. NBC_01794]|uniref:heparan-alpha-glucosaminide N-acetyltransferase domain-containing protein n=1 Tax=Streptomyces sp. NBC_01794 TaxID=2975942 RepID=UPI00308E239D|nr:heparan-alpha-glucosaminide N-acetyltransferase domain-containing protein [Streptomyces sp. NBC_01794]